MGSVAAFGFGGGQLASAVFGNSTISMVNDTPLPPTMDLYHVLDDSTSSDLETLVSIAVDVDAVVSLMPHIRVFGEIGIGLEGE